VSGINIAKKQKVANMAENITRKSFAVHGVIDWLEYRRDTQDTIRLHSRMSILNLFFTDIGRLKQYRTIWGDHLEVFR